MSVEHDSTPEAPAVSHDYVVDRTALLSQPPPPLSRKVMWWFGAALAVIGIGGGILDNALNNPGPATKASSKPAPTIAPAEPTLHAPLAAFLGITDLHGTAPGFDLVDAAGQQVTLAGLRGKVVVLSFFDARCSDICPVLANEFGHATQDLGTRAAEVAFVTVNANPLVTSTAAAARAGVLSGLGSLTNWHFLTGSLATLDAVWRSYGITVDVQRSTGTLAHNDLLYFITPDGTLAYRATPFAFENRKGAYSLPAAEMTRFGSGIAAYARRLLP